MHPINLFGSMVGRAPSLFLTSSPDMQRKSDQDHRIKPVSASRRCQKKHILKNWSTVQEDLDHFTGQQCESLSASPPKCTHSLRHAFLQGDESCADQEVSSLSKARTITFSPSVHSWDELLDRRKKISRKSVECLFKRLLSKM